MDLLATVGPAEYNVKFIGMPVLRDGKSKFWWRYQSLQDTYHNPRCPRLFWMKSRLETDGIG